MRPTVRKGMRTVGGAVTLVVRTDFVVIAGLNHELGITFKTEFTAYRRGVLFLCFVNYHFLLLYFFPEGEDGGGYGRVLLLHISPSIIIFGPQTD